MRLFIGWDKREVRAYEVCEYTAAKYASDIIDITPLKHEVLRKSGHFWRAWMPDLDHPNRLIDVGDGKPFSTEFAFTRFLVPALCDFKGWAMFMDCDMMFAENADIFDLWNLRDDKYAVMCVKHDFHPEDQTKMDDQVQQDYPRKNWSSVILFNCGHPGNKALTKYYVNTVDGQHLHGFRWLADEEIGALPEEWNWLEGHSLSEIAPKIIHFTRGGPWFRDYKNVKYGDLWDREESAMRGFL